MPRILYWNICNFSNAKIGMSRKRARDDADWTAGPPGPSRLRMILDTVQPQLAGAAAPLDFIVVVEVAQRSGGAAEGLVVEGNAGLGCQMLCIRAQEELGTQWALVPPVVTGQGFRREAVAVLYDSDKWYFLGPGARAQDYGLLWRELLPSAPPRRGARRQSRTIPAGYPYGTQGVARPEWRSEGQWRFRSGQPAVGNAPQPPLLDFPAPQNRKPWLTAFGDVNDSQRLVRLLAVHTSPSTAGAATDRLADVWDMTVRPPDAARQIDVILGDFNVDNTDPATFAPNGPLSRLVGAGPNPLARPYAALVRPPAGLAPEHASYYHTTGRLVRQATIADDAPDPGRVVPVGNYPGLAYSYNSVDNVLVRYQGAAGPPGGHRTTILARARDVPYRAPQPPPPQAQMPMLGFYRERTFMSETIDGLIANWDDADNDVNEVFRDADNYGLVHDVSDHFAIVADV